MDNGSNILELESLRAELIEKTLTTSSNHFRLSLKMPNISVINFSLHSSVSLNIRIKNDILYLKGGNWVKRGELN